MRLGWLGRCALACAAAAATRPLATLGQPVPPPGEGPPPAPADRQAVPVPSPPARIKWADLCTLALVDGRLAMRSSLTLDALRLLDGQSDLPVVGLPGSTRAGFRSRMFTVENRQTRGAETVELTISNGFRGLTLASRRTRPGAVGDARAAAGVTLSQASSSFARGSRGGDLRLFTFGGDGPGVNVEANDLATLRRDHPHAANRYARPLLRDLGSDLFQVEPAAARQALLTRDDDGDPADAPATRPAGTGAAIDPRLDTEVRDLLAEADVPQFVRREAATDRLVRLGPPAAAALDRLDRRALSAQQNLTVDLIGAAAAPLAADEARRLRADPHFLLDCLYAPHPEIRAAAAARLARVTRAGARRFDGALALDPRTDVDRLGEAVEALRDDLVRTAAPPPPPRP